MDSSTETSQDKKLVLGLRHRLESSSDVDIKGIEWGGYGLDSFGSGEGTVGGCCEHCNEPKYYKRLILS